ncbi:MAG TPA: ribosomal RNA small subunit methyltransferase A [Deltaproteobacteria bacterium]|nr:ribosomal RNA small subunit methyltransferase A [Deltaproteobacteria bacterium]
MVKKALKGPARAKKRLGQHFLVDRRTAARIVAAAAPREGDHIIEIGPGRGALTCALAASGAQVLAVEADAELAAALPLLCPHAKNLEVMAADALDLPYAELARRRRVRFRVVSNLPYNITGPLLARFLDERRAFVDFILMVQKEVAARLAAKPSTREYGALTVLIATWMDVEPLFHVGPEAFRPRPRVDSTVLRLRVLQTPRVPVADETLYRRVVRAAFAHRRKTLRNCLVLPGLRRDEIVEALVSSDIDPSRRGETLTLEEFSRLARRIQELDQRSPARQSH